MEVWDSRVKVIWCFQVYCCTCVGVLSACMSAHHAHTVPMEPDEITGVTKDCAQPSVSLELNPGL